VVNCWFQRAGSRRKKGASSVLQDGSQVLVKPNSRAVLKDPNQGNKVGPRDTAASESLTPIAP